jgi:1-acyl-sn-glycerol-3-phosphate acyltransferase
MFLYVKTIRTYIFWAIICTTFTLLCIPLTFLPLKNRRSRLYFFLTDFWSKMLVFWSFLIVKTKGEENLPKFPQQPAIFVMNHASAIDIFLAEDLLGTYPHIWMSKHEYSKIPLFGILMKRMHVPVNRENPRAAVKALIKTYEQAKFSGAHVLMFPEGTRYSDGKVHDFLPGFAVLAKKLNRPVIPVAIHESHKIFPKNSFLIDPRAADIKIEVGQPLNLQENESEKEFVERVRGWFVQRF